MISFKQFLEEDSDWQKEIDPVHNDLSKQNHPRIDELEDYASDSGIINHRLWENHNEGKKIRHGDSSNFIGRLDNAISNNKMPYNITVHSGTIHDPRIKKDKNDILHHPSFLSSSLDKNKAKGFAFFRNTDEPDEKGIHHAHSLKINVPEGHPGAYLGHFRFLSHEEKELLLPRNLNLKYLHTEDEPEEKYLDKKVIHHIHHMEIVK